MAQTITRDGKDYVFPDDFTPEQIEAEIQKQQNISESPTEEIIDEPSEELPSDDKRGWMTDIPTQIVGGVRDAGQSAIGLVEDITEGAEGFMGNAVVFGDNANNGIINIKSKEELKRDGQGYFGLGKIGEKDAYELPEVDDADTKLGAFTRGVSQFMAGWYATKPLRFVKAKTTGGKIAGSLARGAVADFIAFDENTGRFVDMVKQTSHNYKILYSTIYLQKIKTRLGTKQE